MQVYKKSKTIAVIALMAFALQMCLPLLAAYTTSAAQTTPLAATQTADINAPSAGLEGHVLVCTAQGFKWVKIADLSSQDNSPQPSTHYGCPMCCVGGHLAKAPPSFNTLQRFETVLARTVGDAFSEPGAIQQRLMALGHFSRAPPQA